MIWTIAAFELRKRRAAVSSYVYFLVFFAAGVLMMLASGGAFSSISVGAGSERVHANAPVVLYGVISGLTNLGVLVSAAVFGQAVHQDYEHDAGLVLFSFPLSKTSYLAGRFLGALLFAFGVFTSIGLGLFVASASPFWVHKDLFGPFRLYPYVSPYLTTVLPNLVVTGALFFSLATLTRKMMPVYVGAVVLALGYLLALTLVRDMENKNLASLLDPFGSVAAGAVTRYWTTFEKNSQAVPLTGVFLENRILWTSLGAAVLGLTAVRFRFEVAATGRDKVPAAEEPRPSTGALVQAVAPRYRAFQALVHLTRLGLVETLKNIYFGIFVLAGAILTVTIATQAEKQYGTRTYPVTALVAPTVQGSFSLFLLIILTFYAGELAWRERDRGFDQISDALPVPTWVTFVSKLSTLCLVPVVVMGIVVLFGVGYQTASGYHRYELGLYLRWMYEVSLPAYLFLCVLALTVQSIVNHKNLGHFVMVTFYAFQIFQDKLGLERRLWKYADLPPVIYSDMNGFGHFLRPLALYDAYWSGVAILLAAVGYLSWSRGTDVAVRVRAAVGRSRLRGPALAPIAVGVLLAGAAGGLIYYNTDVRHLNLSGRAAEKERATYEQKFKKRETAEQPRIVDVKVDLDVYPEDEALHAHGVYVLENETEEPVSTIYVELPGRQTFRKLRVGDVPKPTHSDFAFGRYTFELPAPMGPRARLPLEFDLTLRDVGFKENGNRTDVAANGTFVHSTNFPRIGYDRESELQNDNLRKKYGLPPRDRLPDLEDPKGLARNMITPDADWVTFEATVSTSADQTAVVPGYLDKEWTEGGRRYFHYKMDAPILDFYSVLSARYAVTRDAWQGVTLEIFHHPEHRFDLAEMMRGMKLALAYNSEHFGPYQYRQARILEFPRYASFAQSFPNTIPYSESVGFIAKVDLAKKDDVDFPLYVTAHEISHQWWAHQVVGGYVQGASMLDETLAQYSALMVMKHEFGERQMRRFLKYELDQYLRARGGEEKKEVPLMRVENQPYIHYNKGSVVMYALQDYIGEDNVNAALRAFLERWKFKGPPYPNAEHLMVELRKVTPPELSYVLHDMFETITLYDNRALSAEARPLAGGKFEVKLQLSARKVVADEEGAEKVTPMDDFVDVGALDDSDQPIALERRRIKAGQSEVVIEVPSLPAKAGIDPLCKLIDRHTDDNVVAITVAR